MKGIEVEIGREAGGGDLGRFVEDLVAERRYFQGGNSHSK